MKWIMQAAKNLAAVRGPAGRMVCPAVVALGTGL